MKIKSNFFFNHIYDANCILLLVFTLISSCSGPKEHYEPIVTLAVNHNSMEYIDMESCTICHEDIVKSHRNTPHFNTSAIASLESIKGSFEEGENNLNLDENTALRMIQSDSGFHQQLYLRKSDRVVYTLPFQMVIGSGTKGQSYLFWAKNGLYQLQGSYFSLTDSWVNSPLYPPKPIKARPVPGRCLECHTTFANRTDVNLVNQFDREKLILGIDCQSCHSDVKKHAEYHLEHPNDSIAQFILSHKSLNQSQQLDACALCHSGVREQQIKDNFSFMLGDNLDEFSFADYDESSLDNLDVHGNQYGLLKASACFKKSEKINCTTCHSPHKSNRGNSLFFNTKCMSCHQNDNVHNIADNAISEKFTNCISCHMPLTESDVLKIQTSRDSSVAVKIRTHLISIYDNKK